MNAKLELVLVKLMQVLPISWTSAIGGMMGKQEMLKAQRKRRKWVSRFFYNVEALKGIKDDKVKQQMLMQFGEEFGRLYAETTILQKLDKLGHLKIVGLQKLEQTLKPRIFVAPHISNWEMIFKVFTKLDNSTYVLFEPRESKQRMQIVNNARLAWDKKVELISTSEPMAMKKLKQALQKGSNIFILPDEEVDGMVQAPSLGRQIPYAGNRWMLSRLAVAHNVDVIPLSIKRSSKINFQITVHDKITPKRSMNNKQRAQDVADQIDQLFNHLVMQSPQSWYWLPYLNLQPGQKS